MKQSIFNKFMCLVLGTIHLLLKNWIKVDNIPTTAITSRNKLIPSKKVKKLKYLSFVIILRYKFFGKGFPQKLLKSKIRKLVKDTEFVAGVFRHEQWLVHDIRSKLFRKMPKFTNMPSDIIAFFHFRTKNTAGSFVETFV